MAFQLQRSEPARAKLLGMVIADGTNWDPDNDGKAEVVIYNADQWIEITDLQTAL